MNPVPVFPVSRLSMGLARIAIRPASTYRGRYKQPQPEKTGFEPGHGEQIWIFSHIMSNQIIYSHTPVLDSNRALRQLPFNGKKTKHPKLRKDYWKPMALIQFAEGAGVVGQSVFQKLREFRRLHELSWGYQAEDLLAMDRQKRGEALNDQKANAVADVAAVLGGAGRGNKIAAGEAEGENAKTLTPATVYWADARDREFATSWSSNITHELGLPEMVAVEEEAVDVEIPEEAAQGKPVEATPN